MAVLWIALVERVKKLESMLKNIMEMIMKVNGMKIDQVLLRKKRRDTLAEVVARNINSIKTTIAGVGTLRVAIVGFTIKWV